ncbi:hypothetical protein PG996_003775 [Apiospora saccharicola]|uniref:Uncharacterized protein n=1 Tax=Apiospora saccharicola TaxID=335842 RepID=A0ABR1W296_9PEZI
MASPRRVLVPSGLKRELQHNSDDTLSRLDSKPDQENQSTVQESMSGPATSFSKSPVHGPSTAMKPDGTPRAEVVPTQSPEEERRANILWECFDDLEKVNDEIHNFELWVKGCSSWTDERRRWTEGHHRSLLQRRGHWNGKLDDATNDYWAI